MVPSSPLTDRSIMRKTKGLKGLTCVSFVLSLTHKCTASGYVPIFAAVRNMPQEQIDGILALPPCVSAHGWVPEPPSLPRFQQACLQIPDGHQEYVCPPVLPSSAGAVHRWGLPCPDQQSRSFSLMGVILGDVDSQQFWPISNGLDPRLDTNSLAWRTVGCH